MSVAEMVRKEAEQYLYLSEEELPARLRSEWVSTDPRAVANQYDIAETAQSVIKDVVSDLLIKEIQLPLP